jgi:pyruvate-formate lyase
LNFEPYFYFRVCKDIDHGNLLHIFEELNSLIFMNESQEILNYIVRFTDTYKQFLNSDQATREAECLKVQYPFMFDDISEDDAFAGKYFYPVVYFIPQTTSNRGGVGFGYVFDELQYEKLLNTESLNQPEKKILTSLGNYWKRENSAVKTREAYSSEMSQVFPTDAWTEESGVAFPLYRMSGSQLDYDKLLQKGIPGLKSLIIEQKDRKTDDSDACSLYDSMLVALDVLADSCLYFAENAAQLARNLKDPEKKQYFSALSNALKNISQNKPATLLEAIQLMFIYNSISGSLNFGRMDEYLGDFLCNDLDSGKLNKQQAQGLINGLWKMIIARNTVFDGRLIIGGLGRRNEEHADRFALIALEAIRQTHNVLPQVTLRMYEGMNPQLFSMALDVIAEGNTFPMLYNDDINVPSVAKAFNVSLKEAEQYTPFGCGEYILYHRSFGTPSGLLNLLKALEITIFSGNDPITGRKTGIDLSKHSYNSFDDLYAAYCRQINYFIVQLALQEKLEYDIAASEGAFLFLSILYDDCIINGKAIFDGGIRYLGGTLEIYGFTNTADSLTALKKLVFDEKVLSLEELKKMLLDNFKGSDIYRQKLLRAPKYGNDDAIADDMVLKLHNHVCSTTRNQHENCDLHNYMVVNINNNANTVLGRTTGASADGRLAFTSMANGNAPFGGMDRKGLTAFLNSVVKPSPEIHAGYVQNMKFSKEMLTVSRQKIEALLHAYFNNGGTQAMLTVLNKEDLKNAMKEPEKYANLMVRVGGFSARFVELDRDMQEEILSRTIY